MATDDLNARRSFAQSNPLSHERIVALFLARTGRTPKAVEPLTSIAAEYHAVYKVLLPLAAKASSSSSTESFYLRVSRPCIPSIKTENEVACIAWVRRHAPSVPVPEVLFWASDTTELGYEYIVMNEIPGVSLDKCWKDMSVEGLDAIAEQVAGYCVDLMAACSSPAAGCFDGSVAGLKFGKGQNDIIAGPFVNEKCWEEPVIRAHLPAHESFDTVNAVGPFSSYSAYLATEISIPCRLLSSYLPGKYTALAERANRLVQTVLPTHAETIDKVPTQLSHRDMHFGNIMVQDGRVTGFVDWEFAAISASTVGNVPLFWPCAFDEQADAAQARCLGIYKRIVAERLPEMLGWLEEEPKGVAQRVRRVGSLLKYVAMCSIDRSESEEKINGWAAAAETELAALGV
ncbi:hypothetical protein HDU87_007214 [Geranomyces variabilis]|uniref:Aminoglycoside phosphotransferase domain-containing protein n=1 Tax=Geranomyces variabilis TaxID=109894 RepID=A0AAD5XJU8_9FUNG|nr:hypothetical protein HDU87_007214 [Geranomyces variabilis]